MINHLFEYSSLAARLVSEDLHIVKLIVADRSQAIVYTDRNYN